MPPTRPARGAGRVRREIAAAFLVAFLWLPGSAQESPLPPPPTEAVISGLKAAEALASAGKHAEAAPLFEKLLADPGAGAVVPLVHLRLAASLSALLRYEAAAGTLEAALTKRPPEALIGELSLACGRAWTAAGQPEKAAPRLMEAFRRSEGDARIGPLAGMAWGDHLSRQRKPAEAAAAYARVTQWPEHELAPQAQFKLGQAYRAAGNEKEAALAFRAVAERHWRHALADRGALEAAGSFIALSLLDEARREFERVLKDYPRSDSAPRAQMGLGRIAVLHGQYAVARSAFQAAAVVFAATGIAPEAELRIAETYLAENNLSEAAGRLAALVSGQDRPIAGEAALLLADIRLQQKEMESALGLLKAAFDDRRTGRWGQLAALRLARLRGDAGDPEAAAGLLRELAALRPDPEIDDPARVELARALCLAGRPGEARQAIQALLAARPGSRFAPSARIEDALARLLQGDGPGARSALLAELRGDLQPEARARGLGVLAEIHVRLNAPAEAVLVLREVMEKHSVARDAGAAALLLRDLYRAQKDEARAAEIDRLIGERYAGTLGETAGLAARARKEREAGNSGEAARLYRLVLDRAPARATRVEARSALAVLEAMAGRLEESRSLLTALQAEVPDEAGAAALAAGRAAAGARQSACAEALLRYALTLKLAGEEVAECRLELGLLALQAGRHAEARGDLEAALRLQPPGTAAPRALYALAWEAVREERDSEAAALFGRLLREHAGHRYALDAAYRLGERAEEAGEPDAAARYYRTAAAGDAGSAALYRLGWLLRGKGDWAEAAKAFEELAARFPGADVAPEALLRAGEARLEQVQGEEAARLLTEALRRMGPSREELARAARVGLAIVELTRGRFDSARELAEREAGIDNGFYGARAELVRCEAIFLKDGPKPAAAEYSRAAYLCHPFPDLAAEAGFRTGECLAALGDAAAARRRWQETRLLFPGTRWAERCREQLARPAGEGSGGTASRMGKR